MILDAMNDQKTPSRASGPGDTKETHLIEPNVTYTYKPTRRITQEACGNCRRKKARCGGQRPKCNMCRRLSQDCVYSDGKSNAKHLTSSNPSNTVAHQGSELDFNPLLMAKINKLESSVADMNGKLSSILSALQQSGLVLTPQNDAQRPGGKLQSESSTVSQKWLAGLGAVDTLSRAGGSLNDPLLFKGLLPLAVVQDTIDVFFTYCHNQPYSFFHEATFRKNLSDGLLPDHLTFAVLANSVRFSTHSFFRGHTIAFAESYANRAWNSIVSSIFTSGEQPDVSTVQSITLLGIFDFTGGKGRHASSWVKIGLSVRIAQDLRLMMDIESDLPFSHQEERRRTFWSIYILDRLVSCGRARPPAILETSCQLQLPCDERIWRAGLWERTQTLDGFTRRRLMNEQEYGSFALVVLASYALSRCAQYTLQEYNIRSQEPPWDPNSDFASILSDLIYLESHFDLAHPIPEIIQQQCLEAGRIDQPRAGPIIFAHALFYLSYCLLNHPFLVRRRLELSNAKASSTYLSRSFETCREYASRLTQILHSARQAGCLVLTSFYGYCAVVAGTVHGLNLHSQDESIRLQSAEYLQSNQAFLEYLSQYWRNGLSMRNMLKAFASDISQFNLLASSFPQIPPLDPASIETMWSLMDYSTLSNMANNVQLDDAGSSPNFLGDMNWQCYDFFNSVGAFESETLLDTPPI